MYPIINSTVHFLTRLLIDQSAGAVPTAPLQKGKTPINECPGYDTKQSDGDVPAVLELWEMRSTLSLPLFPGSLWPGMIAPDKTLSMG